MTEINDSSQTPMTSSIRIYGRIKSINSNEYENEKLLMTNEARNTIKIHKYHDNTFLRKKYHFDYVFDEDCTQLDLFNQLKPLLLNFMLGNNSSFIW